jgi:hypothetical protein
MGPAKRSRRKKMKFSKRQERGGNVEVHGE